MYTRILFPTDGSRDSRVALAHLVPLALASGAEVVLLEVIESRDEVFGRASAAGWPLFVDGFLTGEKADEIISVERRAASHHLRAIEAGLHRAGVPNVAARVKEGSPGPVIVDAVSELGCDAIVMASRGRSGLSRFFLRSVSERVVRQAPCPVLLIPANPQRRLRGKLTSREAAAVAEAEDLLRVAAGELESGTPGRTTHY
jgi:nucleotide-binding universal stress UspA family protein